MGGDQVAANGTTPTKLGDHNIIITPHRQDQLDQDTVPIAIAMMVRHRVVEIGGSRPSTPMEQLSDPRRARKEN